MEAQKQQQQQQQQGLTAMAAGAWLLNVLSSVSLVMTNKALMSNFGFNYATSLTALHFVATAAAGALRTRGSTAAAPNATGCGAASQKTVQDSSAPSTAPAAPGEGHPAPHSVPDPAAPSSAMSALLELPAPPDGKQPPLVGPASCAPGSAALKPMAGVGAAQYLLALVFPDPELATELLFFGVIADVSIASMNLSLMLNSIGFYQISKLSVLPAVCLLEGLRGKRFSMPVQLAVLMVTVGVGICTITDFAVNGAGAAMALLAVASTALQQVLIGSLQRRHGLSSFQLLSYTAPVQAGLLLLLGPLCDQAIAKQNIFAYRTTRPAAGFIALSCVLAVLCNLSQYMCLGRFSATSFQVLGNLKTVLVLLCGWLLFNAQLTLPNIVGMTVAMVGMMLYSWLVQNEKNKLQQKKKHN